MCVSCTCTYVFILGTRKLQCLVRGHFASSFPEPFSFHDHSTPPCASSWSGGFLLPSYFTSCRICPFLALAFCSDWVCYSLGARLGTLVPFLNLGGQSLPMDVELPREEIRFTVEFRTADDGHDINRLLQHFGLGDLDCEVGHHIFPTSWPAGRLHDPPVSELSRGWVPWDEPLSDAHEVHLYVAFYPLFVELASFSDMLQGHIQVVSSDTPVADRSQTVVVVRQIPLILLTELVSQLSQQVRALEQRLANAEATIQHLRQHLGI